MSAATDFLDGFVARLQNQQTAFGAWLDPVVDKIVVCSALCLLVEKFADPLITLPSIAIAVREIGVSGLREWYALSSSSEGSTRTGGGSSAGEAGGRGGLSVSNLGKWKTTLQLLSITALLFYEEEEDEARFGAALTKWVPFESSAPELKQAGIGLLWASALLGSISGGMYARAVFKTI